MKIAQFRNIVERFFDNMGQHFHSCVGAREIAQNIQISTEKYLEVAKAMAEVKRAKPDDIERAQRAIAIFPTYLEKANRRLQMEFNK